MDGFPAYDGFVNSVEAAGAAYAGDPSIGPGWASIYRPHGRPWRPGELVRLPALGASLQRLSDAGFADFYEGELGERQCRGSRRPVRRSCRPTCAPTPRPGTSRSRRRIAASRSTTHRPNSSGIVALEILNILEQFEPPSAATFAAGQGADSRWVHLGLEASKLAWVDRDAWVTDPEFLDIPIDRLIDKAYAAGLAARIDEQRATPPPRVGRPAAAARSGSASWTARATRSA